MATWLTLTADDVKLLDVEKATMESVAPAQDLDTCVLSASNFSRGYIPPPRAPAPAVPPECVDDVVAIARASYLSQDPTGTLLTEIRRTERDNAIAHLRDIAKGIVAVTTPDVTESVEPSGESFEQTSGNPPIAGRDQTRGL